jgi:hypothetical protein
VTKPRRNSLILASVGALIVLAAAYAIAWQVLADRWRAGIAAWAASRAASGWTITTGAVSASGFPAALRLTLPEPFARDPAGNAWTGPPLAIIVSPFRPLEPGIEAPGLHRIPGRSRAGRGHGQNPDRKTDGGTRQAGRAEHRGGKPLRPGNDA